MALSSIELCSQALLKIGASTISSFEDGTAEAEIAGGLYPLIRDAQLSAHPWSFATAQASLPRLVSEPLADFDHAFQLPGDFLKAISAGQPGVGRGLTYRVSGQRLHASTDEVVLTYVYRPAEGDFPPFFSQTLVARLAAEFCLPLTENTSRADRLRRQADDEFSLAKLIDSQQDTPSRLDDFPLVGVRGTGSGPLRGRCW